MRDPSPCRPRWKLGNDFFDGGHTRKYVPQNTRESTRPPPLWMAINVYRGLCWCGEPRHAWEPGQRRHCCYHHYHLWAHAIHASWSVYRDYLVRVVGRCEACGAVEPHRMEVDHIEALALGGSMWDPNNHSVLCRQCHRSKTADDHHKIAERRRAERNGARLQEEYGGRTLEDYMREA